MYIQHPLDTVYYIENGQQVVLCTTDANGKGSATLTIPSSGKNIIFYSSIAKALDSESNPYSKNIRVSADINEIKVMPDGLVLYWYGNKNGFDYDFPFGSTYTIFGANRIYMTNATTYNSDTGVATKQKIDVTSFSQLNTKTDTSVSGRYITYGTSSTQSTSGRDKNFARNDVPFDVSDISGERYVLALFGPPAEAGKVDASLYGMWFD